MSSPTIEIIVTTDGHTRLETKGFAGPACREASRFLEQALGMTSSECLTAEFHAQQPQANKLNEGSA